MDEFQMYLSGMSINEVSISTGVPRSTLRFRFNRAGILRTRSDGIRLAAKNGRLGSGNRGSKRVFTQEWKDNISKSKTGKGIGITKKPSGYIEITMGEHKGRGQHVVVMEELIGRKLFANECVHHKDHNKENNEISNLEIMTRAEHSAYHAKDNLSNRKRNKKGEFV